ncbi:MAG TPA: signal peptidase II [Clostridiales bacterium]|nr:signal peptidase II [Clostridiales bacterium]
MYIILAVFIVLIDQATKYLAIIRLKDKQPIFIINNFLQLKYVENRGAAFGILQNKQMPLIIFTFLILIGIIYYLYKNRKLKKISKISLWGIIGGSIGNLIDRIRLNFVVDFIDVNFWGYYDFPVFNLADSFLVVFTILLSILVFTEKYERVDKFETG